MRSIEGDGGDRRRFARRRCAGSGDGARRQRLVEDRTRPDFVPVVILGVDPEDGDGRHVVVARHLLGELDRRQRLEQREERAAEQARLLAGDDGDRPSGRPAVAPASRARGRRAATLAAVAR